MRVCESDCYVCIHCGEINSPAMAKSDLAAANELIKIVSEVRKLKSNNNIALNTPLDKLIIYHTSAYVEKHCSMFLKLYDATNDQTIRGATKSETVWFQCYDEAMPPSRIDKKGNIYEAHVYINPQEKR